MRHHHGFTLVDLAIVVAILIVIALLVIPAWRAARRSGGKLPSAAQLTALAKNMVLWSDQFYRRTQDFPRTGLIPPPPNYTIASNSPTDRMAALCNMGSDTLNPSGLVNPVVGTDKAAKGKVPTIVLHSNNLSYAVLDAENFEWKNRINAFAPLACDKQVGKGTFWDDKFWQGEVVWGDSHVSWEGGEKSTSWPSTTINGHTTVRDDLFAGTTGPAATDAVLINP